MTRGTPDLKVEALGAQVAVRLPLDAVEQAREAWRWCLATFDREADSALDLTNRPDLEPGQVQEHLSRELTLRAINHQRGQRLMVHAACVVSPTSGRGLVLVGESGAGKTTAAIHLCSNGFRYVTDETVALDDAHHALLYRKPLSMVEATQSRFKAQRAPETLGMSVAERSPQVGAMVLLARDPTCTAPSLEPVSLIDALADLIPQTSSLVVLPTPLTRLVDLANAAGGVQRLRYREIGDTTELLRVATDRSEPTCSSASVAGPRPSAPHEQLPPGAVIRADFHEACTDEDDVLVLIGDTPVRLAGIGATIWKLALEPQQLDDLVAGCVAAHGKVPEAEQRVRRVRQAMLDFGVLCAGPTVPVRG
ncbi:hypothetical protein [Demetria terragena]|uniref:hypothetical protein n=1 Tax=Demetria terragena TaxID=63959 RepID=UPI00036AB752|nr:hypothetical protein [Demetria terragena]